MNFAKNAKYSKFEFAISQQKGKPGPSAILLLTPQLPHPPTTMIAKKNFFTGSAYAAAMVATSLGLSSENTSAATVTEVIGNTIVQTSSFSFVPSGTVDLDFSRFDTQGGASGLTSVFIEISLTKSGGEVAIDNDSGSSSTVDLTHRVAATLNDEVFTLDLTKTNGRLLGWSGNPLNPANNLLRATSTVTGVFLEANDGDSIAEYNSGGADNYIFNPADATVADSGEMDDSSQFIGASSYTLVLDAGQTAISSVNSGMFLSQGPSTVTGFVKVTYTFTGAAPVPEPSSFALLGSLGTLALLRRRR